MIAFRNFALRRGERLLLSNIDLTLHAGTRVGVVGRALAHHLVAVAARLELAEARELAGVDGVFLLASLWLGECVNDPRSAWGTVWSTLAVQMNITFERS